MKFSILFASLLSVASVVGFSGSVKAQTFNAALDQSTNCRYKPGTQSPIKRTFRPGIISVSPDFMLLNGEPWYREQFPENNCWIKGDLIRFTQHGADGWEGRFIDDEGNIRSTDEIERGSGRVTSYQVPRANRGVCDVPSDYDSRGRRCGRRAASVRPGGR